MMLRGHLAWRWLRIRNRWDRRFAPYRLAPDSLFGYDGEPPYFVRADLASTPQKAAEYLAQQNEMTVERYARGMNPIGDMTRVWMVPQILTVHDDPDPDFECEDDDCNCHEDEGQYLVVPDHIPGAVAYWRWGW